MTEDDPHEPTLFAAQVRAARALLGWSQGEMAANLNIGRSTIADLETGKRQPQEGTAYVIVSELVRAGVTFTEKGVELREFPPPPFTPTPRIRR